MQDKLLFKFTVIADTHIRLLDSAEEGGYPSNRLSNHRAKNIVQCLNRIKTESDSSRQFGPEYSELQVVAPGEEFGRNDTAKLGYFIVKVFTGRHEIVPIRKYGEISIHPETTDKDLLLLTDCKV